MSAAFRLDRRVNMDRVLRVILLALAACLISRTSGNAQSRELIIYECEDPARTGLDPYRGFGSLNERFVSLYCRPLFQFLYVSETEADGFIPYLAEPLRPGDKSESKVIVRLRKDALFYRYVEKQFKDQSRVTSPVTAKDIITTYRNLVNPDSELGSTWYADRLRKCVANMTEVSPDAIEIRFKPGRRPLDYESILDFPIIPAEGIGEDRIIRDPKIDSEQDRYEKKPWGSGPFALKTVYSRAGKNWYRFERVTPDNGRNFNAVMVTNVDYMQFALLLRNECGEEEKNLCIPALPIGLSHALSDELCYYEKITRQEVNEIMFNVTRPALRDRRVRAALSAYVNRESLINSSQVSGDAEAVTGPIPRRHPFYCVDCQIPYATYDTALGNDLLRQAGWTQDRNGKWKKNGAPLRIEILCYEGSEGSWVAMISNSIAQAWSNLGIEAGFKPVAPSEYDRLLKENEFDAAFRVLSYHVYPELDRHFGTNGSDNYGKFSDPQVDSLWREFRSPSTSKAEHRRIWHDLHRRIGEMVPGVFLWTPREYAVWSRNVDIKSSWLSHNFIGLIERWESGE